MFSRYFFRFESIVIILDNMEVWGIYVLLTFLRKTLFVTTADLSASGNNVGGIVGNVNTNST